MNIHVESSVRAVERRLFYKPELKPAHELEPAKIIGRDIIADFYTVHALYELGQSITDGYAGKEPPYAALAYTQIPDQKFREYGISPDLTNCMYLGSKLSADGIGMPELSRTLILNPTVITGPVQFVSVESCGSIKNARVEMAYVRPKLVYLSGIVYQPGRQIRIVNNVNISGIMAAVLDHEAIHLGGKTALSDPSRMINILKKNSKRKQTVYGNNASLAEIIDIYVEKSSKPWLIYERNQFKVVVAVNKLLYPLSHHTYKKIPLELFH